MAFIPKGVLRPLFFTFFLHFTFLFEVVLLTRDLLASGRKKLNVEMFYGDALDAYNQEIGIHDLQNARHGKRVENQMFYDLVSGVFYCTTSSLLILLFTRGIIKIFSFKLVSNV